jgi:hypothetical protein
VEAAKFIARYEIIERRYESLKMIKTGFDTIDIIEVSLNI